MGSDSTMISDLAVRCRKNQPPPASFYNLGVSGAIAANRLFPPLCFSKVVFQVEQHNWFGHVLKPNSVN